MSAWPHVRLDIRERERLHRQRPERVPKVVEAELRQPCPFERSMEAAAEPPVIYVGANLEVARSSSRSRISRSWLRTSAGTLASHMRSATVAPPITPVRTPVTASKYPAFFARRDGDYSELEFDSPRASRCSRSIRSSSFARVSCRNSSASAVSEVVNGPVGGAPRKRWRSLRKGFTRESVYLRVRDSRAHVLEQAE
jgi:hypothetical protein